jgi:putative transposase
MDYNRQSHAVYYTRYHLVISTKFRRKILKGGLGKYLTFLVRGVTRRHPELEIVEVNTDVDHVHILLGIAPKMSVSDAVKIIKTVTAVQLKKKFPFLINGYWDTETIWSIGYFVSTVGLNESVIARYIEMQGLEDSGQAKLALE